jgi:hypothetical protein
MSNPNAIPPEEHKFKPGQSGNPNGRPKGTKNLATIIRELEAEDFDWTHVPIKNKEAVMQMGSPFKAIVLVALGQAVSGDKAAREWLRKAGYGDKLDITSNEETIQAATIIDLGNLDGSANKHQASTDSPDG